jgi:DNA-binding CsgD family transcriptional regulator
MADAASSTFVGRSREMAAVRAALRPGAAAVVVIHGPGGIGKTRLLDAVCADQQPHRRIVRLDCGDVEPTDRGFLAAVAERLGCAATVEAVADGCARGDRPVCLALDTAERLRILQSWLRRTFLPALPAETATVLATRDAPHPSWLTAPEWHGLVSVVALGPLDDEESERLLVARGLAPEVARRVQRYARGFPLALDLVAALPGPGPELSPGPRPEVVDQIVRRLVAGLSPRQVRLAEAAAVVRRVTEPLLTALLDDGRAGSRGAWDELAALPFVTLGADGLSVHETVHECLTQDLEQRDPVRFADLRHRAAVHLIGQHRASGPSLRWRTTADLLYLVRAPLIRDAFFPPETSYSVDPARAADESAITALVARSTGDDEQALLALWWQHHPEAFAVTHDADGTVVAVSAVLEHASLSDPVRRRDPVVTAWQAHLDAHPLSPGSTVLLVRWTLCEAGAAAVTPQVAPLIIDLKRRYLELHPRLRRVYIANEGGPRTAVTAGLGFVEAGPSTLIDGVAKVPTVLEMGPRSIEGWLERLLQTELRARSTSIEDVVPARHRDRLDSLSDREREVLRLLADGLTNREIASRLVISEKTANRHVSNVFAKIDVTNRTLATRFAVDSGLVDST